MMKFRNTFILIIATASVPTSRNNNDLMKETKAVTIKNLAYFSIFAAIRPSTNGTIRVACRLILPFILVNRLGFDYW